MKTNSLFSLKEVFNLGIFIFISIYWFIDAILLFFMKPSPIYFLIEIIATALIGTILLRVKGDSINKKISIRKGIYISAIMMLLNFGATIASEIWF